MAFDTGGLVIDPEAETERICSLIRKYAGDNKRSGAVIGLSGGIDSALSAALCVRALGREKVLGLIMPEKESNPISAEYAARHARQMGIPCETFDLTSTLEAFGVYQMRDRPIRDLFPDYDASWKMKISLPPDLLARDAFSYFTLKVEDAAGNARTARLSNQALRAIVAATDVKQRSRMVCLYYYSERDNRLVCGTTNRTEMLQGYFVKYGDGGVDIEPIAHLFKAQVYRVATHLGVTREIIDRAPSPDTFSLVTTDEEFFFRIPYEKLDLLLYAWESNVPAAEAGAAMGLSEDQVKRAFRDFGAKFNASRHTRMLPPSLWADA